MLLLLQLIFCCQCKSRKNNKNRMFKSIFSKKRNGKKTVDFQTKNQLKSKYYELFRGKIESSVVDMVLDGCSYDETDARQQLAQMCDESSLLPYHNKEIPPSVLVSYPPFAPGIPPTAPNLSLPPAYHEEDIRQQKSFLPKDLYLETSKESYRLLRPHFEREKQGVDEPIMFMGPPPPRYQEEEDNEDEDDDNLDLKMKLLLSLQLLRIIDEVEEEETKRATGRIQVEKKLAEERNKTENIMKHHDIPKHWPRNNHGVTIIPVKGELHEHIQALFFNSPTALFSTKVEIQSIEELCNWNTYDDYMMAKYCMDESKRQINEKELWYAPPVEDVENICYRSFDVENQRVIGAYGKGKYFYKHAARAHINCMKDVEEGTTAYMFLANVIVGEFTQGTRDLDYIPLNEAGEEYNSCVDDLLDPSVFVKFYKSHCYPRYLITYKVNS